MQEPSHRIIEVTVPSARANVYSFFVFLLAVLLYGSGFVLLWNLASLIQAWKSFLTNYAVLLFSILLGACVHELIHALVWALSAPSGFRSVKFGFDFRNLAPYVHCKEYLELPAYRAGVIAPGLLLGVLPAMVGIIAGHGWLLCFGTFFTAGAAGDFYSLIKLRPFESSSEVLDHPDHLGFFVRQPK
jgi:hypothetical protein